MKVKDEYRVDIKDRIKKVRQVMGITQSELASQLGVNLNTVQRWEMGYTKVNDRTIKLISEKFGVSERWLKTGEGEMWDNQVVAVNQKAEDLIKKVTEKVGKVPKWFEIMLKDAIATKDMGKMIDTMTILIEELPSSSTEIKGNIAIKNSGNMVYKEGSK